MGLTWYFSGPIHIRSQNSKLWPWDFFLFSIQDNSIIKKLGHRQGKDEQKVLHCKECKKNFSISEKLKEAFNYQCETMGLPKSFPETRQEIDQFIWNGVDPGPTLNKKYPDDITENFIWTRFYSRLIRLIYLVNQHDWRHRKSCFKSSDMCRYRYPRKPTKAHVELFLNSDHDVCHLKCEHETSPPFIYISTYPLEIMGVLGCNVNISYVFSSRIGFYFCGYSTKNQAASTNNVKTLKAQIKLYLQTKADTDKTDFQKGLGVLASALLALTGQHAISDQIAFYYILNGERFIYSHAFAPLILGQLIDYLLGNDLKITYDIRNRSTERLSRYLFRSPLLESYTY